MGVADFLLLPRLLLGIDVEFDEEGRLILALATFDDEGCLVLALIAVAVTACDGDGWFALPEAIIALP